LTRRKQTGRSHAPDRCCGPDSGASAGFARNNRIRTMKDVRTATNIVRPIIGTMSGRADPTPIVRPIFSERLSQMAKFAEIGKLATGIIHEINNPLACLRSNVDMLLNCVPRLATLALPETLNRHGASEKEHETGEAVKLLRDVNEILEDLVICAELVTSISQNLKSLAYSAHDAPKKTDLHACIEAALRVSRHELKYRVSVKKDFGTLPHLMAYPGMLIQVFLNLFVNAAHAIEGEGVLRIRTRPDADGVIVEVSDTGLGITAVNLKKVFRPFFTTKPLGGGLGLSICKRVIDHHGGKLEVSSSPGKGTMFRIRLPREVRRERHSSIKPDGKEGVIDPGSRNPRALVEVST